MLIEVIIHLLTCLSGPMQLKENFERHDLKLCSELTASSFGIVTFIQAILSFEANSVDLC